MGTADRILDELKVEIQQLLLVNWMERKIDGGTVATEHECRRRLRDFLSPNNAVHTTGSASNCSAQSQSEAWERKAPGNFSREKREQQSKLARKLHLNASVK